MNEDEVVARTVCSKSNLAVGGERPHGGQV